MSTNTGNRGPLTRMNTTPYVRHIVPLLWTQTVYQYNSVANSDATGRLAWPRSKGAIRCRLAEWRRPEWRRPVLAVHFCMQLRRHAILHWSWRKQPQRIEFEIKWSWTFVKHTKVLSTATNITKPSGEYTHPIPYSLLKSRYVIMLKKAD